MFIDPTIIQWALISGASLCAFMVGLNYGRRQHDIVVENTILYLVEEGFVKWKNHNGEIELVKLEDDETSR